MVKVNVNDLSPGMVVNKDIVDYNTGTILISSGTVLNRKIIFRIKNLGIKDVDILEKDNPKYGDEEIKFMVKYEVLSDKAEKVFSDIKFGKKIIITEITDEMDDFIKEVVKNDNILGRMRQLEEKDNYTFNHSLNVCMLSTMIGKWLGYSTIQLKQLALGGLFHDIGKLRISNDIINKPGKLTEDEYEIIKKHTNYGYEILSNTIGISKNVCLAALQHHEREDGSGYPNELNGDEIHEFAKIVAVCDIYDDMTSDRVYKERKSPLLVAEYLDDESFEKVDPRIARIFLDNISEFYVGNEVKLSNGEVGKIIYVHPQIPTKAIVKVGDKYINFLEEQKLEIVDVIK